MATSQDIMKRIQNYDRVHLFLVLDKNGKKINPDLDDAEGNTNVGNFSKDYSEIPKLVNKAVSCLRDIEPLVNILFLIFRMNWLSFKLSILTMIS